MKLTKKEIQQIIKETEEAKERAFVRYLAKLGDEYAMEYLHDDWGDRD